MDDEILKVSCVLFSLLLNLCYGKLQIQVTDDIERVSILKQNFPSDYVIPVSYIPKEVAGSCWVTLNIYPLEQSFGRLVNMFGPKSTNKGNLSILIMLLQTLRMNFDHWKLELVMQDFYCHYKDQGLLSGHYFDYVEEFLRTSDRGPYDFSCEPPPCPSTQPPCTTPQEMSQSTTLPFTSSKTPEVQEEGNLRKKTPLLLILITITACVVFVMWRVKPQRHLQVCSSENIRMQPTNPGKMMTASLKHD